MSAESSVTLAQQLQRFTEGAPQAGHIVAPGKDADHERGVLYRGPWETFADGFNEHVRRSARALAMAGAPVHLRSMNPKFRAPVGDDRKIDTDYADLLNASIRTYAMQVHQVVPLDGTLMRLTQHRHYTVEQQRHINERKVIYTVWERQNGIDPEDVKALNLVGQAWVGCEVSATMLKEAGVDEKKVRVVPCPFMPNDPHLVLAGRARKPGPVRFYHIGKWEARKEQRYMLGAFLMAFKPGEAMLLLKTSDRAPFFDGYPVSPEVALSQWLEDERCTKNGWSAKNINRGVFLLTRQLTTEQMVELHKTGDVYLSLSRGEGMDMPGLDAKLAGNLMVYTPSGGPQGYATVEDVEIEATGLVPCHPFYNWHSSSMWIDYDVEAAAAAMREAFDVASVRTHARPPSAPEFAAATVGKRMLANLKELGDL